MNIEKLQSNSFYVNAATVSTPDTGFTLTLLLLGVIAPLSGLRLCPRLSSTPGSTEIMIDHKRTLGV